MRVLVVPVLVGTLFDRVLVEGDFSQLGPVLLTGGLITVAGALALWLQDSLFGRLAATVSLRWRDAAYASLLKRDSFGDRKSTRLNSSHVAISYAVFCLKKKTQRG